ncbi:MAG: leucyl aminopeptidase [Clostridiales bacterium]
MKISLSRFKATDNETVVLPLFKDNEKFLNNIEKNVFKKIKEANKFNSEYGEIYNYNFLDNDKLKRILFLGLGKEEKITLNKIRKLMSKLLETVKRDKDDNVYLDLIKTEYLNSEELYMAIIEGLMLSDYSFDKYKSKAKTKNEEVNFTLGNIEEYKMEKINEIYYDTLDSVNFNYVARDLVNEPANFMTPEKLASVVKEYSTKYGFEADIFEENKIKDLDMKAFLSVSMGSELKPKLIVMRYFGDKENKDDILGLVGKGLTYDSGGYSIKTSEGMKTMKSDMGGAAAVIGAMSAISKRKLKINVISVVASCENMISGKAYRPGDIIGSMSGKTIEVLNTDAEGRLTLADAVYYAVNNEKVTKIVDVATLTGAATITLGTVATAALTNDDKLFSSLNKAGKLTGEKVWQLPIYDEYKEEFKSKIADLKNVGSRAAGTITAGLFIKEFIENSVPWIHLDIASTSWSDSKKDYYSVGGTGVGVRLLYNFAKNLIKK